MQIKNILVVAKTEKQNNMQEYIYEETKYIKRQDLKDFNDLLLHHEFAPEDILDEVEFNIVFQYLLNLTIKAPDFLPPYEYAFRMIGQMEQDKDILDLESDLEQRWFKACEKIAHREDIYSKHVPWGFLENRPLIRGLFNKANNLWKAGKLKQANELFSKILKTNENDNIGARYSVKATGEGMSFNEFEERFTQEDESGSYFKNEELWEWYGE